MSDYQPGSFFLVNVHGLAGFGIGLGQALAGAPSRYEHAGMIIGADGSTVEARPGGAIIGNVSAYEGRALLVSDGPVLGRTVYRDEQMARSAVVAEARRLVGVPYSALDYVALAALHLHLPSKWIRQRVQSSGHMICSQLVDAVYARAGIHLFDDGRLPGDVMPSDLAAWAEDWIARKAS